MPPTTRRRGGARGGMGGGSPSRPRAWVTSSRQALGSEPGPVNSEPRDRRASRTPWLPPHCRASARADPARSQAPTPARAMPRWDRSALCSRQWFSQPWADMGSGEPWGARSDSSRRAPSQSLRR